MGRILAVSAATAVAVGVGVGVWLYPGKLSAIRRVPRVLRGLTSRSKCRRAALGAPQTGLSVPSSSYPKVRRDESIVETLHGVQISDPYRWLEDPDSEETKQFVEAQNRLTEEVLQQCDTRDQFKELMTKLYDYEKFGTPFKRGGRYFYYRNSGLQQQYVLYTQSSLHADATVLLDPNTLSEDGTVALRDAEFSDNGKFLAYSLSSGGSDWSTIQVLAVGPGGEPRQLDDELKHVKFSSIAWTHDNKGFFYNRYPKPTGAADVDLGTETDMASNQQLCYHVLGRPQSEDAVVLALPEHPTWMMGAEVTDDGRYVLIYVTEGCQPANRVYYVDLQDISAGPDGALNFAAYDFFNGAHKLPVVRLVDDFTASYNYVANEGDTFFLQTNLNAPRYRVVKTSLSLAGPPEQWPDVVPQHPKDLLQSAVALQGDNLVLRYLRDVVSVVQLHSLTTGQLRQEVPVPGVGSIGTLSGTRKSTELFFNFQSFVEPGAIYRLDVGAKEQAQPQQAPQQPSQPSSSSNTPSPSQPSQPSQYLKPELYKQTLLKVSHFPSDYVTRQVFVTSRDGTRIPMFICHRKGIELNGANPTLLYGYGGFNISLEPTFSAGRLAFIRGYDGIFAMANLRGGGEYGTQWRDAGSTANKQNVFDDFQAAAEWLVSHHYTTAAKLTIQGGSNGGLLVAACANQRPDLYAAVIAQVGVLDMLRFHKFTIGHAWVSDYGSPDEPEAFKYILPYSPLHNIRLPAGGSGQYPAMILATGDHDDRVVPLHSFKHIAELQHTLVAARGRDGPQRNPLLIRIEVRAGHGAGKPTAKVIQEQADLFGFAAKAMGARWCA